MNTKICGACKLPKSLDDFHRQTKNADGRQSVCKDCRKELDKAIYQRSNKKKIGNLQRKSELLFEITRLKQKHGCSLCPEVEPACLDFHHPNDNKEDTISNLIRRGNKTAIYLEIDKCVLLCANCHRKVHAGLLTTDRCANSVGVGALNSV